MIQRVLVVHINLIVVAVLVHKRMRGFTDSSTIQLRWHVEIILSSVCSCIGNAVIWEIRQITTIIYSHMNDFLW